MEEEEAGKGRGNGCESPSKQRRNLFPFRSPLTGLCLQRVLALALALGLGSDCLPIDQWPLTGGPVADPVGLRSLVIEASAVPQREGGGGGGGGGGSGWVVR